MDAPLIQVRDLSLWFQQGDTPLQVLDHVSFDLHRGETYALLGESGCGKSMTALTMLGLLPSQLHARTSGEIIYGQQNLLELGQGEMRAIRGNRISMIFQEPMTSLNPVLSVEQQIAEVLKQHQGLSRRASQSRTVELLDAVGIPAPAQRAKEYPHQLSGGMKQRVMIAMALASEPDVLIADEPTTALDVTIQAQVLELLQTLQQQHGMSILLITHDLGVVSAMADRLSVMYAGQIVEQSAAGNFVQRAKHPYSQKLFAALPDMKKRQQSLSQIPGTVPALRDMPQGCRFAPRCQQVMDVCKTTQAPWLAQGEHGVRCHLYTGELHALDEELVAVPETTLREGEVGGEVLLRIEDLRVRFKVPRQGLFEEQKWVHAVDGVSLSLQRGRTLALVGESGCGKTTLGKAVLQLVKASTGKVLFDGEDVSHLKGDALRQARRDFQMIFQDAYSAMNPRMRVEDIVTEGLRSQGLLEDRAALTQKAKELMNQVGLNAEQAQRFPHEFSGGQRQRICIARALALEPRLIVCDEPTSALDVSVQAQVLNLLKRLQQEKQLSYLFITHNISVVAYLAHEVAVMYLGRVVEQGRVDEVLERAAHPYTQALLSAVPAVDDEGRERVKLEGDPPSPMDPPAGCHFHPRCSQALPQCRQDYPEAHELSAGHVVHCHLYAKS